ncbi:LPXTG cell wall anchor domain-containing protein [Brevibacterium aurantiacum]|uniref:Gram-positive cocci surface proteins LPxTG domain-containing protein n=1 Tax=Brevibacterium aurantiacum TaxID=273384 RepID=A0A2A3YYG1_BREAU|nr:hypothetical protein CIK65_01410 [Brevibacterium aurantiacum]
MQKKLVQSSLALTAAAALGLGGAFVAGPSAAADKPEVNVGTDSALQTAVFKNLADKNGDLPSEVGRFGVQGDTLVLGVSKETKKVSTFSSKYENVDVVVDSRYTAGVPQASKNLVGGAGYLMSLPSDPNSIAACSTGFAGWDASGNQIVLTAGHCAVEADGETQTGILDMEKPSIAEAAGGEGFKQAGVGAPGTWGFHQYGSEITTDGRVVDENKAIDFAVVNVADGFTNKAEVTDWTTASSDDLSKSTTKITEVGSETPGAAIQKSGRTTGVTEGTVVNDPEAFEYANIGGRAVHGFEVTDGETRFSDHGDSGGAVYQGDTAVGVISGGPEAGGWSWVADLDNSLEKSGKTITFEDPNEEPPGDDDANADAGADAKDAEADADGNDSDAGAAADAKNAESNADSDGSKDGEAPEERKLSIEPKEVSASDFVKQDKGVQIMAAGFEEGEKVSLEVVAGPENVEGITLDETANADGVAAFSIYGTSASDPSVYLGKYNVEVTGANDTEDESALTGSFEVVADEDGNGGGGNDDGDNGNNDDDGNGDGGSDLPRTGAELTGLAAGAGLLVVGGAAVVLTMRRKKNN